MQTLTNPAHGGIHWTGAQITWFRRSVLQENTRDFGRHWVTEAGKELGGRTVESWEQHRRRPSYFVRQQMSSGFRDLARNHRHLWNELPPNPE